jgi:hypothetical protein
LFLSKGERTIWFSDSLILICEADFRKSTTSDEETGGIGSSPVLETMFNSIAG